MLIAMMNSMFGLRTTDWVRIYVDDMCCYTKTFEDQLEKLQIILETLWQNGLTLKLKNFATDSIRFLGHFITGKKISVILDEE